jgi:cytochrome c oxidase subunit 3
MSRPSEAVLRRKLLSLEVANKGGEVTHSGDEHGHGHEEFLWHQFEDRPQQDESYVVGMWSFLVTEILFFGALFLAYSIFRIKYPEVYAECHSKLNIFYGGANTVVLLTSSLSMALGVYFAQTKQRWPAILAIGFTILCAFAFLFIKLQFEWVPKYHEGLVPGPNFHYFSGAEPGSPSTIDQGKAMLFFGLYFAMTGLHGIHVVVGIGIMGVLALLLLIDHPLVRYYMPIELAGLYWHFVDIVWIFLFPLFYLIGK